MASGGRFATDAIFGRERQERLLSGVDVEAYCEKTQAITGPVVSKTSEPVAESWVFKNVKLPSAVAVTTMICIVIYEILAIIAMFVRELRYVMVELGLMYLLLGIIGILLILLLMFVLLPRIAPKLSLKYLGTTLDQV